MKLLVSALNLLLATQVCNAFSFIGTPSRQTCLSTRSFGTTVCKPNLIALSSDAGTGGTTDIGSSGPTAYTPKSMSVDDAASAPEEVVQVEPTISEAVAPSAPSSERPGIEENKVYIGNLSYEMEEASLKEIFDEFGSVTEISLPINRETGTIRGFGFITFESKEMAENAIEGLQGKEILGRNVYCNTAGKDAPKRPQQTNTRNRDAAGTKLYVGNLNFETTLEELSAYFENFGTVVDAYMPTDRETREPRGFAFVTMSEEESLAAIEQTDGYEFGGRTLRVNKSLARGEKPPPREQKVATGLKLYVGNLSFDTEQETLESFFADFGNVIDCYMPQDRNTGRTRGFAFVTMAEDDAMKAIEETDGYELDGRHLRVNEAQPKGTFAGGNRSEENWGNDDSWDNSGGESWDNSGDDSWDNSSEADTSTWETE